MTAQTAIPRTGGGFAALTLAVGAGLPLSALVVAGAMLGGGGSPLAPAAVPDIPAPYLLLYRTAAERFRLGPDGWSLLAAVGKVECDHGRSPLQGCRRGEQNSAGARGPAQFLPGTWSAYGVDGDGDGARDLYDPVDAIAGMANYLRASGAPEDWHRALFAYNRATWYVDRVLRQAAEYRAVASQNLAVPVAGAPTDGSWLAPLPGFPGERCDARIVRDVMLLVQAFGVGVTDCFGGAPHALDGEHPLGLAIDAVPADGDWRRTELLARRFGWREACASSGCPGAGPFRVVLYNGYPGHGDPRYAAHPHIHLSWHHGPTARFTPAPWVRSVFAAAAVSSFNDRAASCAEGGPVECTRKG